MSNDLSALFYLVRSTKRGRCDVRYESFFEGRSRYSAKVEKYDVRYESFFEGMSRFGVKVGKCDALCEFGFKKNCILQKKSEIIFLKSFS